MESMDQRWSPDASHRSCARKLMHRGAHHGFCVDGETVPWQNAFHDVRLFVCFSSCSSWISSSHVRFFSENSTKWGWKVIFRSHSSSFWQFKLGRIFQVWYSKVSKVSKVSCVKKSVSCRWTRPFLVRLQDDANATHAGQELCGTEKWPIELTCEYIILYNYMILYTCNIHNKCIYIYL